MKTESVAIASLVLDPANARKHSAKNLEAIKGSLAKFGQQKPIVIGKGNVVIAGNGTLEAARALEWTSIKVVRTKLDGIDAVAFAIADNRTTRDTLVNPRFPIYIVSKGRADSRLTSKAFEAMKVPYSIIVEDQEYKDYAAVIDRRKILVLDKAYQRDYDTFSEDPELGGGKGTGSGPARNFAWDHSLSIGAPWHWTVDDNISMFNRLNYNLKVPVGDGTIFRCMEDFCLRYKNISMAGPNYFMFASRKSKMPPFVMNTRIYSCNLIRGDVPFRWRGRYNEDTDLSLRMLKAKYCTVLFNAFLQYKTTTLKLKGGNTDGIYKGGTTPKSRMLVAMHPDVATVVWKFGRVHHHVDYRPFKHNKLIKRTDIEVKPGVDNYGMSLAIVG